MTNLTSNDVEANGSACAGRRRAGHHAAGAPGPSLLQYLFSCAPRCARPAVGAEGRTHAQQERDGVAAAYGVLVLRQVGVEALRALRLDDLHARAVERLDRVVDATLGLVVRNVVEPTRRQAHLEPSLSRGYRPPSLATRPADWERPLWWCVVFGGGEGGGLRRAQRQAREGKAGRRPGDSAGTARLWPQWQKSEESTKRLAGSSRNGAKSLPYSCCDSAQSSPTSTGTSVKRSPRSTSRMYLHVSVRRPLLKGCLSVRRPLLKGCESRSRVLHANLAAVGPP